MPVKAAPGFVFVLFGAAACLLPAVGTAQTAPRRCAAAFYDSLRQAGNPAYRQSRQQLERQIREAQQAGRRHPAGRIQAEVVVIPVVVHVVHHNRRGMVGGAGNSNISDEQIRSQIQILANDYRRRNEDTANTPEDFRPVAADMRIGFRLATRDPNGLPTSGITRHYGKKASYEPKDMDLLAELASWPTDRYLNIWVTTIANSFIGYAQFPDGTDLDGLEPNNGLSRTDGVMIDYRNFGVGGAVSSRIYNLGRTTTHEVGHWLGLIHTWGDTFCGDDFIGDTPPAEDANNTTDVDCPPVFSECGRVRTRNMTENYLDYSPDACMNLFTKQQAERVQQVLALSPRRRQLIQSLSQPLPEAERLAIGNVFPNPAANNWQSRNLRVALLLRGTQDVTIEIISMQGRVVVSQRYPQTASEELGIDVSSLGAGLYLLRVRTATESDMRKVVLL